MLGENGVGKKAVDEKRCENAKNCAVTPGGAISGGKVVKRWYVAQVNRGRERFVQRELYPILHCVVPLRTMTGGAHEVLFPDYVFVQMDLERDPWQRVNYTRGVKGLLFGEHPVAIPSAADVVKLLEARSDRKRTALARGMIVKITSGPFSELNGVVDDIGSGNGIVQLLMGSLKVSIPINHLVITCDSPPT